MLWLRKLLRSPSLPSKEGGREGGGFAGWESIASPIPPVPFLIHIPLAAHPSPPGAQLHGDIPGKGMFHPGGDARQRTPFGRGMP